MRKFYLLCFILLTTYGCVTTQDETIKEEIKPSIGDKQTAHERKEWQQDCSDKGVCGIHKIYYDKNHKPLIQATILRLKNSHLRFFIRVPLGVDLKVGLGVAVDKQELIVAKYSYCRKPACTASFRLTDEMYEKIKRGKRLQIAVLYKGKEIVLSTDTANLVEALALL